MTGISQILLGCLLSGFWLGSFGAQAEVLDAPALDSDFSFSYLRTTEPLALTAQDLAEFVPMTTPALNFGFTTDTVYVLIKPRTAAGFRQVDYVVAEYPLLDQVAYYTIKDQAITYQATAGDAMAFAQRHVDLRFANFAISHDDDLEAILLQINSSGSMQIPIGLYKQEALINSQQTAIMAFGLYYGIMLVMVVYNLILFVLLRERFYFHYVFYVASYSVFQAIVNGFAFQYLWPNSPWWANVSLGFFGSVTFWFIIVFAKQLLNTKEHYKRWNWVLTLGQAFSVGLAALCLVLPYNVSVKLVVLNSYFVSGILLITGVIGLRRGFTPAKFFLVGWGAFLVGITILGLKNHGILPSNFVTTYAIQIGSSIEVVLLSLTVAAYFKYIKTKQEEVTREKDHLNAIAKTSQMLAHDVRRPFSMLEGTLHLMSDAKSADEIRAIATNFLPEITAAGNAVQGMIRDVMEVGSSTGELAVRPESPRQLIHDVLVENLSFSPKDVTIRYHLADSHLVVVDKLKVRRVFSNIVNNALHAVGENEIITFSSRQSAVGWVRFAIHNTGSTIPGHLLKEIFKPFYTAGKKGGTGLGLAIVKKIIKAHGGRIGCQSDALGTEFWFTLPMADELDHCMAVLHKSAADVRHTVERKKLTDCEASDEARYESALLRYGRRLRILVADDEIGYRELVAGQLGNGDRRLAPLLEVEFVTSGEALLERAWRGDYDLILTDVDFNSGGLDGFQVVKRLREAQVAAIICICSQGGTLEYGQRALEVGAQSFLPKPLTRAVLLKVLLSAAQELPRQAESKG